MNQKEWMLAEDFDAEQAIAEALAIICGQTEKRERGGLRK